MQTSTLALGSSCAFLLGGTKTPDPGPRATGGATGGGGVPAFFVRCASSLGPHEFIEVPPNVPDTIFPPSPLSSHSEAIIPAPSRDNHQAFPTPARPRGPKRAETGLQIVLHSKYLEPNGNARKQRNLKSFPHQDRASPHALLSLLVLVNSVAGGRKKRGWRRKTIYNSPADE